MVRLAGYEMLQALVRGASSGSRRCYHPRATVLPKMYTPALSAHGFCCKHAAAAPPLLQTSVDAATNVGRRCYKSRSLVLHGRPLLAATVSRRCYKSVLSMLQGSAGWWWKLRPATAVLRPAATAVLRPAATLLQTTAVWRRAGDMSFCGVYEQLFPGRGERRKTTAKSENLTVGGGRSCG